MLSLILHPISSLSGIPGVGQFREAAALPERAEQPAESALTTPLVKSAHSSRDVPVDGMVCVCTFSLVFTPFETKCPGFNQPIQCEPSLPLSAKLSIAANASGGRLPDPSCRQIAHNVFHNCSLRSCLLHFLGLKLPSQSRGYCGT